MAAEPVLDITHLSHVELLTPKPDESLRFRWTEEERKKGQAWGLKTIESFHTHGTPPVETKGGH